VRAAKLHGAGNDFLLFDGMHADLETVLAERVRRLCDRRLGLGADGVLLVQPTGDRVARVVYWNADGSPASFCANGTRCAARFAAVCWGWTEMQLETGFAYVPARVAGTCVELELPAPTEVGSWQDLAAAGQTVRGRYLVLGVPHLVVPVDWPAFWRHPLAPLAPELRAHPELPAGGANVTFFQIENGVLLARSFERGVEDETLSCGSGAVAAALVAISEEIATPPMQVRTASERILDITPCGTAPVCPSRLVGPAEWVADMDISPELF
jgi:diaminopimelate epimerase